MKQGRNKVPLLFLHVKMLKKAAVNQQARHDACSQCLKNAKRAVNKVSIVKDQEAKKD